VMGKINGWRVIKQGYGRASVQGQLIYTLQGIINP